MPFQIALYNVPKIKEEKLLLCFGLFLGHEGMTLGIHTVMVARLYTAISINVVGLKRQAYATRPNGGLGIHWNLHIVYSENYKILFLCVKPELAGSAYV